MDQCNGWGIMDRVSGICQAVARVTGVDQYILVDHHGRIVTHDMEEPERISRMVHTSGQRLSALGRANFMYVAFSRRNNRNLLIFPVGIYHLGVIKQPDMDNAQVAGAVMECLNTHPGKSTKPLEDS